MFRSDSSDSDGRYNQDHRHFQRGSSPTSDGGVGELRILIDPAGFFKNEKLKLQCAYM